MIWMFDCVGKLDWNISNEGFVRMVWKRPRQSIFWCNCPVLLDLGTSIVQIVSMPEYKNDYWYGYECYPDEMQITLTTGDFIEGRTTALKQLIEEGAA